LPKRYEIITNFDKTVDAVVDTYKDENLLASFIETIRDSQVVKNKYHELSYHKKTYFRHIVHNSNINNNLKKLVMNDFKPEDNSNITIEIKTSSIIQNIIDKITSIFA